MNLRKGGKEQSKKGSTHLLERSADRSVIHALQTNVVLDRGEKVVFLGRLVDDEAPLFGDRLDHELILLGLDIEVVDEVPEQVEWARARLAEQGEVALVVRQQRVHRLPRRSRRDLIGLDQLAQQLVESLARLAGLAPSLLGAPLPHFGEFLLGALDLVLEHGDHVDRFDPLQFGVAVPLGRAHDQTARVLPPDRTGEVQLERLEDRRQLVHVATAHLALANLRTASGLQSAREHST